LKGNNVNNTEEISIHTKVTTPEKALNFFDGRYILIQGGSKAIAYHRQDRCQVKYNDGKEMFNTLLVKLPDNNFDNGFDYWWFNTAQRYEGFIFDPSVDPSKTVGTKYNLWKGFSYLPDANGNCDLFLDHIKNVVCNRNVSLYEYVMTWFAQMVQQPTHRPGIVLALRGEQGTGKSIIGQVVSKLYGDAALSVNKIDQLTCRFNGHLAGRIFIVGEETLWGGDKTSDSELKSFITDPKLQIEEKGRAQYTIDNHAHILLTSNSDWMAPVGLGDRRYCVLDVSNKHRQDHAYFGAIWKQLEEENGYAKLLHTLTNYDISKIKLYEIPDTEARQEQIEEGISVVNKFVLDSLRHDTVHFSPFLWLKDEELTILRSEAYQRFKFWARDNSVPIAFITETRFTKDLVKLFGIEIKDRIMVNGERPYIYRLPDRETAKAIFTKKTGIDLQVD
jgi:hypothetical protein